MRFVWAVVAFVLAALLIGAGIAQRTLFLGPPSQQAELSIEQPEPFVLVDGAVLRSQPGAQTLLIRGQGEIFAAYGRTADLEAWLADSAYNAISVGPEGEMVVELVEPEIVAPVEGDGEEAAEGEVAEGEGDGAEAGGAETAEGRNPAGSDLWLDAFTEQDQLITDMQLPEGMSVLIARDGTQNAPDDIVVSWPLDTSTPWAGPLMAAGAAALLAGIVLYILGIRHQRRGRGPRRKGPGPLPPTEPIDLAVLPARDRAAIGAEAPAVDDEAPTPQADPPSADEGREARSMQRRRRLLALPALGLVAVLAAGCSSDSWPQFGGSTPEPSATPTVIAPENQKPPAITEAQASRILQGISTTLTSADADLDIDLATTRLDGAALAARRTDYTLREQLTDRAVPAAIPTDRIEILLPEATDVWPRTVLLLAKSAADDTVPPVILTMTQADQWSNYKVTNLAEMQASAELPELAPAWLGTKLIPPDSAFLTIEPGTLAEAFADVVDNGDQSASYALFDAVSLQLATSIQESRQAVVQALADNGAAETSDAAFDAIPSASDAVAMASLDSGAIVAVSLVDSERITPTSSDAVIKFGDNPEAKTLTGVSESAKGVETTYGLQLFFAVPTQGSTEQIRLLAVHQDLLDVKVIK